MMFISYMCTDEADEPMERWVNVKNIDSINRHCIEFSSTEYASLNPEQYDELMKKLDSLGLLHKPNKPMPPVGDAGGAFQEFMNTKGRKDND